MHERRYSDAIQRLRSPERIERLEVERVVDLALQGLTATSVLDVGTGTGVFAEAFQKRNMNVVGIDPNLEMLKAAKEYVPAGNFVPGVAEAIPFPDKSFDLVFLGHVLHESDDIVKALRESSRCARQRLVVLEWPYKEEAIGPPLAHRLKPQDVLSAATQVGFSNIESIELRHAALFQFSI